MRNKTKKYLLVIDDNRDLCHIISNILKDENCIVTTAYDGKSGLDKLGKQRYDLMLLDYQLPGKNGLAILQQAIQIQSSLLTIMMSAFRDESALAQAMDYGAIDFLDKPFTISRLVNLVRKTFEPA